MNIQWRKNFKPQKRIINLEFTDSIYIYKYVILLDKSFKKGVIC
jgi:hypothetical protein